MMARVDLRLVLVFLIVVAVVSCADNATTAAPTTAAAAASATTTAEAPTKKPGILEVIETFVSAIPVGIATACETGAEAVKSFFQNPWW